MASIWSESIELKERPPLSEDLDVEVAVIGAGMAGILIASFLQKAGCDVAVLEARRIAGGQTRNTTAKITSQHGLLYAKLIKTLGEGKARLYAAANEDAIRAYRELISAEGIACDFEEKDAYVYSGKLGKLAEEAEAAKALGLPASLAGAVKLPFPAVGAVRFEHQAQFHPLKFIAHVSEPLKIYENTPVLSVKDDVAVTDRGKVRAKHIVFATHYPFINFPGLYFARMHQERSYVLALENAADVGGMWIGADDGGYSLRNYGNLLLLGGGGHRTGDNTEGGKYARLSQKAKEWFPDSREAARWSAQDCMTPDSVPYIGRYADSTPNWYVATGFQKWGMTSSMVAARLIQDLITGQDSPYAPVFDPGRLHLADVPGLACETGQAVKGLAKGLVSEPSEKLHTRCPHLGCRLEWNPDEASWDCPCHGSRFTKEGKLLSGPAQTDLTTKEQTPAGQS